MLESIESSLIGGFIDIMLQLRQAGREEYYNSLKNGYNIYFHKYFQYVKENQRSFKVLLSPTNSTGFSSRFTRAIMKTRLTTTQFWNNSNSNEMQRLPLEKFYREEVLSAVYVSLISTWLNRDLDLSEKVISEVLVQLWKPISQQGEYPFVP